MSLTTKLLSSSTTSALLLGVVLCSTPAHAFWVVNFGSAKTLPPAHIGFAAGVGGQAVFVSDFVGPSPAFRSNAFGIIPHAGLRLGLANRLDMGVRLAPVPLPFSTVGPSFGFNLDLKVLLTAPDAKVQAALIAGAGLAHVLVLDANKFAWSPNGAVLLTFVTSETLQLTLMARYVYLAIPTATGGMPQNAVHIAGPSVGLKIALHPLISLLPEMGAYWYEGRIGGARTSGPGIQVGIMLATSFSMKKSESP